MGKQEAAVLADRVHEEKARSFQHDCLPVAHFPPGKAVETPAGGYPISHILCAQYEAVLFSSVFDWV